MLAGDAVGDDVLHLAVHLVVADALRGGRLDDGVRHRVGVVLFQAGRDLQDFVLSAGAEGYDLHDGGGRVGQRAGFVKHDGVGVGQGLKIFAALDCDVVAAALAHGGQHGQRHRQLERTGKIDHQNRDRTGHVAGQRVGHSGAQQTVRHQLVRQGRSAGLAGRLQLLGVLDHLDDLVIAAVAGLLLHGHGDLAFLDDGAGVDDGTVRLAHRLGLAGQRCLVDAGLAVQHFAVQRDDTAGVYDDGVACADLGNRHQHFALGGLLPDAVDIQRHTAGQVAQGLLAGPFFQQFAQAQQEHDRPGGREVAAQHRNADGQRVEHFDFQLAPPQAAQTAENVGHAAHQCVGHAQRCRQEQLARKVEDRHIDELFLIFAVDGAGAVGRDFGQGLHIELESGQPLDDPGAVSGVDDHDVTGALIHGGSAHTGQGSQVVLQLVCLG